MNGEQQGFPQGGNWDLPSTKMICHVLKRFLHLYVHVTHHADTLALLACCHRLANESAVLCVVTNTTHPFADRTMRGIARNLLTLTLVRMKLRIEHHNFLIFSSMCGLFTSHCIFTLEHNPKPALGRAPNAACARTTWAFDHFARPGTHGYFFFNPKRLFHEVSAVHTQSRAKDRHQDRLRVNPSGAPVPSPS